MEIGNVLPHDLDAVKAGGMVVRGGEEGDGGAGAGDDGVEVLPLWRFSEGDH